jgi:parallel beta-helix repeat protein
MSRKLVFAIFFALLLVGFLNLAKIQSIEVAVCSGYEANLTKAALFLNSTQFDSAVGLCREAPNAHNNTFWLVSDNLLAYHALKYYYPETAEAVYAAMLGYGYFRSYKHEVVFGTTIPYIPFKTSNTYVVSYIGTKLIETEVCNGSSMDNYKEYADLCIFAALHFYWSGNIQQAIDHFNIAKNMWNGTLHGIYDKASKYAENKSETLIFSTYKLTLLLYCSRILGQPLDDRNSIEETLWLMQDEEYGGLHTDYDINLNCTGSDMNTETTSIAILAYKYEPKIVNRPLQYPPSLNIPPDYQKIQEAVNRADIGDTVFVYNGTYYENVIINKALSLVGENCETSIIDGSGIEDVVKISMNNVTITGFTIINSGLGYATGNRPYSGIALCQVKNCNVNRNKLTSNRFGIILCSSSHNDISENNMTANKHHGIGLWDSSNYNNVSRNDITSNYYAGIEIYRSDNNLIIGNAIAANNVGGIYVEESSRNTIKENNITQPTALGSVELGHSSNYNMIFHNNFYANDHFQASVGIDCQGNSWDDGYLSGGNYWRNCTGKDENGDGICDSAYIIDGNNKDNYPLISPWPSPINPKIDLFWMQWWFWTIVLTGTAMSAGAVFFLRKRQLPKITFKYSKLGLALKQLNPAISAAKRIKWKILLMVLAPYIIAGIFGFFAYILWAGVLGAEIVPASLILIVLCFSVLLPLEFGTYLALYYIIVIVALVFYIRKSIRDKSTVNQQKQV